MSETAAEVLRAGIADLRQKLGDQAARDARILLAHAMGIETGRLTIVLQDEIAARQSAEFAKLIAQRMARKPVSQIIGRREFWGRRFVVSPDVLDPRPETETLVSAALDMAPPQSVLDLGVGSGCIIVSLLSAWPHAAGLGVDVSGAALAIAAQNVASFDLGGRVQLEQSDWFSKVGGRFDLVVSNPPYISETEMENLEPEVSVWEPTLALTPGGDGLAAYRIIAKGLDTHLAKNAQALFEIGKDQAEAVCRIFKNAGFGRVWVLQDLNGQDRTVGVMR